MLEITVNKPFRNHFQKQHRKWLHCKDQEEQLIINTVLHEWISVAWDKFPKTASYVELISSEAQITKR